MKIESVTLAAIPDLSDLFVPVAKNYLLNMTLRGPGPSSKAVRGYLGNFIRLTDRAIQEYTRARLFVDAFVADRDRLWSLIEALSEFEACLSSTRRTLRFFDRLRSDRSGPQMGDAVRLIDSYTRRLVPMRNAIEHMDKQIGKDLVAEGQPITLSLTDDGLDLTIAAMRLRVADLAGLLRHLHSIASAVADPRTSFLPEHLASSARPDV